MSLKKPILMTGGGGYNIENTARAWARAWSVLCGEDDVMDAPAMGGVMLESTEWAAGLQDRELEVSDQQKQIVTPAIETVIQEVKSNLFALHGL